MPLPINVAAIQYSTDSESKADNQDKAVHLMDDIAHVVDLLLLPEDSFNRHKSGDDIADAAVTIPGPLTSIVSTIAVIRNSFICYNLIEKDGDKFYQATVLTGSDGRDIGVYRKVNLTQEEIDVGFSPGSAQMIFRTHLGSIGIMSASDLDDLNNIRWLNDKGVQLVLVPSSLWETESGAESDLIKWVNKLRKNAVNGRCHVLWANKIGNVNGLHMLGSSMVIGPKGEIIAKGTSDKEEAVREQIILKAKGPSTVLRQSAA